MTEVLDCLDGCDAHDCLDECDCLPPPIVRDAHDVRHVCGRVVPMMAF